MYRKWQPNVDIDKVNGAKRGIPINHILMERNIGSNKIKTCRYSYLCTHLQFKK